MGVKEMDMKGMKWMWKCEQWMWGWEENERDDGYNGHVMVWHRKRKSWGSMRMCSMGLKEVGSMYGYGKYWWFRLWGANMGNNQFVTMIMKVPLVHNFALFSTEQGFFYLRTLPKMSLLGRAFLRTPRGLSWWPSSHYHRGTKMKEHKPTQQRRTWEG